MSELRMKPKALAEAAFAERDKIAYSLMFLLGLALLGSSHFITIEFFSGMFKEVGFALIVSIFLIFTIERFTRQRHAAAADAQIDEISRDIFHAVFKRYIPEKVFEEVERAVMAATVAREDHELDYTLEDSDVPGHVKCEAFTAYKLRSIVDDDIVHVIVMSLELPINPRDFDKCRIEQVAVGDKIYLPKDLAPYISRNSEHCTLRLPIKMAARSEVRIRTRSCLMKRNTDVEVWSSRLPSDGLKLRVVNAQRNLSIHAVANHSRPLVSLATDGGPIQQWELRHGIFPYQSIMFWWSPKLAVSAADDRLPDPPTSLPV